jgi:DNA-binding transcriptional regulator YiaG
MTDGKACMMCGSKSRPKRGTFTHRIRVGSICFDGELDSEVCSSCGEHIVEGALVKKLELMVAQQLADNGQRTPEAFRFMRKALGLRAVDLAPLIGVGPETISRYETGAREIDPIRFGVLATLVDDSLAGRQDALTRFRAAQQPVKSMPRKVALKVA